MSQHSEEIPFAKPVMLIGNKVVVYDPNRKRPKEYVGPTRVTKFAQTIVVAINGRTNCLEADQWSEELEGNRFTLKAKADQPTHKPSRFDFFDLTAAVNAQ